MSRRVALVLTVLTGFSGLVYEVAWQKYLATLLGAHSEATAAVLGIFLAGLSVGYSVFGAATRRRLAAAGGGDPHLLRFYGSLEAGIGIYALLFPSLFGLAQRVSFLVPAGHEAAGFVFDLVLTALLLLPPTILMGGTIPILTQALSMRLEEATRVHAWVYGFNTFGAFLGALCGGFFLVPWLGLDGVLYAMAGVNLSAGALFVALDVLRPETAAVAVEPEASSPPPAPIFAYVFVAFLAGFAMMCLQTVLNRVAGLSLGASQLTFAMIVAVFVLCIALGSFAVSTLSRVPPILVVGSQWLLVALLAALYFLMQNLPYFAHVLRAFFRDIDQAFYIFQFSVFLSLLALLALPIGFSGALLPLLFHHLRREFGDLGSIAGRLYGWNTVGSLVGAVLGGYVLLFWVDLDVVYRIAVAALAIGAAILTSKVLRFSWVTAGVAAAFVIAGLVLAFPTWDAGRLSAGLFRVRTPTPDTFLGPDAFFSRSGKAGIIFHRDDPTSTVAVKEYPRGGGITRSLITNGKSDGSLVGDYPTAALSALLPALLAEHHERAFVVGWGLGVTVGELAALEDTKEVVAAEISPGVMEAAPLFDYGNQGASRNPKVRMVRSDAYRALLRSEGDFDVIASEPSNPWVTGVEMLYSKEFLSAARDRLRPGGAYAQWFHTYEVDDATVELVLRTYRSVFDHVSVWYTTGPDVLLLAIRSPDSVPSPAALRERFARPDFREAFRRAGISSLEELLSQEVLPMGVLGSASLEGPVHTLRHPILGHSAARGFFRGGGAELPRMASFASAELGIRNSLLRRQLEYDGGQLPADLLDSLAEHACHADRVVECFTLLARAAVDQRSSQMTEALRKKVREEAEGKALLDSGGFDLLVELYGGREADLPGVSSVETAQRLTDLYARFYNHALPFDRDVVERAWTQCRRHVAEIEACRSGRNRAADLLGPHLAGNPDGRRGAGGVVQEDPEPAPPAGGSARSSRRVSSSSG